MYFTPSEDENRSYAASCLAGIAVTQREIGSLDAAAITMGRALETARAVASDDYRSRALHAISVAQTRVGDFAGARQTLDEIVRENHRRLAQGEIAAIQARAGFGLEAVRTSEAALIERGKLFEELAQVFGEIGDRESLKRLLQPCSHEPGSAYGLCVLLAKLYPEQLTALTEAVARAQSS